eukprot:3680233-Pyramimonas_sp.AAC.1
MRGKGLDLHEFESGYYQGVDSMEYHRGLLWAIKMGGLRGGPPEALQLLRVWQHRAAARLAERARGRHACPARGGGGAVIMRAGGYFAAIDLTDTRTVYTCIAVVDVLV